MKSQKQAKNHRLWRVVQDRRNTKVAKRLLIRLMKKQGCLPKRIVTDKLRSYGATRRQAMPAVGRRQRLPGLTEALGGERTFAWLGRCRRLAKDFENLSRNALAFRKLASIRLMLRRLCSN